MPSSKKWKIVYTESCEHSLQKLIKEHYRKKKKDLKEFKEILKKLYLQFQIEEFPRSPLWQSKPEPLPKKRNIEEGQKFAKLYLKLPGLKGASGEGRLLYLIDEKKNEIKLLYWYTHEEFATRPPDKVIRKLLKNSS